MTNPVKRPSPPPRKSQEAAEAELLQALGEITPPLATPAPTSTPSPVALSTSNPAKADSKKSRRVWWFAAGIVGLGILVALLLPTEKAKAPPVPQTAVLQVALPQVQAATQPKQITIVIAGENCPLTSMHPVFRSDGTVGAIKYDPECVRSQ